MAVILTCCLKRDNKGHFCSQNSNNSYHKRYWSWTLLQSLLTNDHLKLKFSQCSLFVMKWERQSPFFIVFFFNAPIAINGLPQDGVGATHGKFDIFRLLIVNFPPLGWQTKRHSEHWVKMPVILIICKWEIYPLASVCELESSMSPKQRERIC